MQEEVRQEAVRRYLADEKPKDILRDLKRSRPWLYKWIARYRSGGDDWYVSEPRAPRRVANRTSEDIEALVVKARCELENTKYAQIGANAIKWRLKKLGLTDDKLPEVWTINRIIARYGLKRRKRAYESKAKPYPKVAAHLPNDLHQADVVGPRYLKVGVRFYSLNVLDLVTHRVAVNPIESKNDASLAHALFASWSRLGLPRYVQLDNQQALRGANRYPRSFGLVIRCCLNAGVTPIFIPISEPWRNPEIERFNDVWDKVFFRTQHFDRFDLLCTEASVFEAFHNENHRYSALSGKTPQEALQASGHTLNRLDTQVSLLSGAPTSGTVKLIRFIRSDGKLDIFSERFQLDKSVVYEYVTATIYVKEQRLIVDCQGQEVTTIDYKLPWL
ncbi:MAG: transposase [Actinobacteria bacterium]|nr:transposase [Actinomycetota bacterium]